MAYQPTAVMCSKPTKYQCRFCDAQDRRHYWLLVWSIEDVKSQAESNDLELTDKQAEEILEYFQNHYDYVWETSWAVMDASIEECQKGWQKTAEKEKEERDACHKHG